jgi:hypothetical protein
LPTIHYFFTVISACLLFYTHRLFYFNKSQSRETFLRKAYYLLK